MKILLATTYHLDLLVPLFDQYRQFYKLSSDPDGASIFLSDRLKQEDSVIFLAQTEDGSCAGFVQLYPSFSSLSMKRLWILNDLFVSPMLRKQNVAKVLMDAAEEFALGTGAKGLTLMTATDNLPAQSLYEKRGWKKVTQFFTFSKSF